MNGKELVWVEEAFAKRYIELEKEANKNAERIKAFEEYMQGVEKVSREEFKCQWENLEEDVAIYTGLMLKVKQAFEKAKNEQLEASYKLWEQFEKEIPSIRQKTESIISELNPLEEKLKNINDLMGKIRTWEMDKVIESIEKLSNLYGNQKQMIEFLVNNFKSQPESK